MSYFPTQTVTQGAALLLQDAVNGQPISFTRFRAGDGAVPAGADPSTYTGILNPQLDLVIDSAVNQGDGTMRIRGHIDNKNVTAGFYFREIGLYCQLQGAPSDQLFSYANAGGAADFIPAGNGSTTVQNFITLIVSIAGVSANVSVVVVPGTCTQLPDFEAHLVDAYAHPQAFVNTYNLVTTLKQGLVRSLTGPSTDYFGGDGYYHPGLQAITANVTLFVALGNPDVYPNFSSIQNALAWLAPYFIISGVTVTISVAAGTYAQSAPILVTHPQGSQILIRGTIGATTTISAFVSTTGTTGNYSVTFSVANSGGFAINDWLLIDSVPGLPGAMLNGFYQLTAISGSNLTVKLPFARSGLGSIGPIASGNVRSIKSIIAPNAGVTGLSCGNFGDTTTGVTAVANGLGMLQNLGFVGPGPGSGAGITVGAGVVVNLNSVGIASFSAGFGLAISLAGIVNAAKTMVCGCSAGVGVNGMGSTFFGSACASSYHAVFGYQVVAGDLTLGSVSFAIGNGSHGVLVGDHAHFAISSLYAYFNAGDGLSCTYHAFASVQPGGTGSFTGNVLFDVQVGPLSMVTNESGTLVYSTSSVDSTHFGLLIP